MFFHYSAGHRPEEPKQAKVEEERAKYIVYPDGTLVIDDQSLLLSKEISSEEPSREDIEKMDILHEMLGWIPLKMVPFWAQ